MLNANVVTSYEQFRALNLEWNNLLGKGGHGLFLSHDWISCCVEEYGNGKSLNIIVVRDNDKVVGIAPFWSYYDYVRGCRTLKVGFIVCSDTPFVDFIVEESRREEIIEAILQYMNSPDCTPWDLLNLNRLPEDSSNYHILKKLMRRKGMKSYMTYSSFTPYVLIQGTWEEFLKSKSVKFRKTRRNIINRIKKIEKAQICCYRQDTDGRLLENMLHVSNRSWKKKEGIAISSRGETVRFYEKLNKLASDNNWLMVYLLKVDGKPIAIEYDLECGQQVYALRADFDENYREYSPGAYLEYHIMETLFSDGFFEYNTGPGLNKYKMHWTDNIRKNIDLYICNDNLKGRFIWMLECKIIPYMKRIRDAINKSGSH